MYCGDRMIGFLAQSRGPLPPTDRQTEFRTCRGNAIPGPALRHIEDLAFSRRRAVEQGYRDIAMNFAMRSAVRAPD